MIAQFSKFSAVAFALATFLCAGTAAASTPPTPPGFKTCGTHHLTRGTWGVVARPSFSCAKAFAIVASLERTRVPAGNHFAQNKAQTSAGVSCMGLYASGKPAEVITCGKGSNPMFTAYHTGK